MMTRIITYAATLSFAALPAFATMNAPDAQMHFKAVAHADVSQIMDEYSPDATLHWVGGPLDGTYRGKQQIAKVWSKFTHHFGKAIEMAKDIRVDGNPKGMTVTARVKYRGKSTVLVRYVLVYRDRKIVDEIWQVNGNKRM